MVVIYTLCQCCFVLRKPRILIGIKADGPSNEIVSVFFAILPLFQASH